MRDKGDNADNITVEDSPFPLTDTDKYVLSLTDEEYQYHYWDELREVVGKSILYIAPETKLTKDRDQQSRHPQTEAI
jgi:hypothetical protein